MSSHLCSSREESFGKLTEKQMDLKSALQIAEKQRATLDVIQGIRSELKAINEAIEMAPR